MSYLAWDFDKNQKLKDTRGVCFADVMSAISQGRILDDRKHHNAVLYPNQRILIVDIRDYVYLVPYVESGGVLFLKTIIPSRKATRRYLGGAR